MATTPKTVYFTGLEIVTSELVNRIHHGPIPQEWHRCRFNSDTDLTTFNRWLTENIEGRWAILSAYRQRQREITIAFEQAYELSLFVLNDGVRLGTDEDF